MFDIEFDQTTAICAGMGVVAAIGMLIMMGRVPGVNGFFKLLGIVLGFAAGFGITYVMANK